MPAVTLTPDAVGVTCARSTRGKGAAKLRAPTRVGAVPFPLAPVPSYWKNGAWGTSGVRRNGVFVTGDTITVPMSGVSGARTFTLRDYWGNIVQQGSLLGTESTYTLSALPKYGWYRFYLNGPKADGLFGTSYGVTNICSVPTSTRFQLPLPGNTAPNDVNGNDLCMKGALGMGTSRLSVGNPLSNAELAANLALATIGNNFWTNPGAAYLDPVRPRYLWCSFPNGTVDALHLPASVGDYVRCYVADPATVDGTKVFVSIAAGSSSGAKITVNYPDAGGSIASEVYDNLADSNAAVTALNVSGNAGGPSAYARAFVTAGQARTVPGSLAATAIGSAFRTGVSGYVASLYAAGVTRFEGPSNEPILNAEVAQQMRIFQDTVHLTAGAVAIGPCPVDISNLSAWRAFLAAGGAAYCDELAFHAYNCNTLGDINLFRNTWAPFRALLDFYGVSIPMWQTESTQVMTSVYGVTHVRRARVPILTTLQFEQVGVPRERNNPWYDASHGFWAFPAFWENADGSLNPWAIMYHTLADQTWGMTHQASLDFGAPGNDVMLGSVYAGSSGQTVVIQTTADYPGATVTLQTSATGPLTVTDAFNNPAVAVVDGNGRVQIDVGDVPTYLSLPVGASVSVYQVNDWPPIQLLDAGNDAAPYSWCKVGPTPTHIPVNRTFDANYGAQTNVYSSPNPTPEVVLHAWETGARMDRVLIVCGSFWQNDATFATFTVDTSVDGSAWVTQASKDISAQFTSFVHGCGAGCGGTQRDTYAPDAWIHDIKFPAPVTARQMRLSVASATYGGEPDSFCVSIGGQGASVPHVSLQRVFALCDDSALNPAYASI